MPRTIVVGHDFSPCAAEGAQVALADVRASGGTLLLIHASTLIVPRAWDVPTSTIGLVRRAHDDTLTARLSSIADQLRAEIAPGEWPVEIVFELVNEPVADALMNRALARSASGIIVGAHGRSSGSRLYLGSVAERLLRESQVPVLVVKAREEARAVR
jgi:nucleotide-binding universal stress UspA family protein